MINTGTGTGPTYPAPRYATPGSRMGTLLATVPVAPVASTNAKPRATPSVPSVAMNGTICARVTNNPFTAPIATPAVNPAATANHGLSPLYVISRAANTAPTARTDPT